MGLRLCVLPDVPRFTISFSFTQAMTDPGDDGEIPLLPLTEDSVATAPEESDDVTTPLPRLQIGILMLILLAEPISSQSIYPFINQVTHCSKRTRCTTDGFLAHRRAGHHRR
jgi:hypothetical protein